MKNIKPVLTVLLFLSILVGLKATHDAEIDGNSVEWAPEPTEFSVSGTGSEWETTADVKHRSNESINRLYIYRVLLYVAGAHRDTAISGFTVEDTGGVWITCPVDSGDHYKANSLWLNTTKEAYASGVMVYGGAIQGSPDSTTTVDVDIVN